MNRLVEIKTKEDIIEEYKGTPIELLIEYHNFNRVHDFHDKAKLLIGMCMDNRECLHLPDNFAYIIRTGGANLKYSQFNISYAIAVGQVKYIAIIGHNNCGMVNLNERRELFIQGLIENAGWDRKSAEVHFNHHAPRFEIGNEIDFILNETAELRERYTGILVAPFLYNINDHKIYLVDEES